MKLFLVNNGASVYRKEHGMLKISELYLRHFQFLNSSMCISFPLNLMETEYILTNNSFVLFPFCFHVTEGTALKSAVKHFNLRGC